MELLTPEERGHEIEFGGRLEDVSPPPRLGRRTVAWCDDPGHISVWLAVEAVASTQRKLVSRTKPTPMVVEVWLVYALSAASSNRPVRARLRRVAVFTGGAVVSPRSAPSASSKRCSRQSMMLHDGLLRPRRKVAHDAVEVLQGYEKAAARGEGAATRCRSRTATPEHREP